ncbi:hypothetical protein H9Q13_17110 [Pontibacter sp. JH31]|uniref:Lipoprotein n=1 Tax=Pontibacter aquaedesilientis TaxID=2766980 RepID=A0ABR7XKV6_9BACT|nr:hypothetical protein [Pontibacter aquaedesilientis]MBD1398892.1 hypothetical protein [Pontibacter aquaedesilientis]
MKNTYLKSLNWLAIPCLLLFSACQKDNENDPELDTETIEVDMLAQMEFSTADGFAEESVNGDYQLNSQDYQSNGQLSSSAEGFPACATRSFNANTRTLVIDFGTENCVGRDGRSRRGKIIAVFTGQRFKAGSTITITLQDYHVNDNKITGTKTKTYLNSDKMHVAVQKASITTPKGTFNWSADRTIERIAGGGTWQMSDDVYLITGRSEGTNRRGVAFNTIIEKPLKRVMTLPCIRHFVSGKVKTTTERGYTIELDFDPIGGEPCDKIAQLTVNGRSKLIDLQ